MSDKYPQIAITLDKAFKQCSTAARDLGLTISRRWRLVVSKAENKKNYPNADFLDNMHPTTRYATEAVSGLRGVIGHKEWQACETHPKDLQRQDEYSA